MKLLSVNVGLPDEVTWKGKLVSLDNNNITIADITQLYVREEDNLELLHRAAQLEALPKSWRDYFQR